MHKQVLSFCRFIGTILVIGASVLQGSAQVSAGFSVIAPTLNCNPAVYSFTDNSSGVAPLTYAWNFGVYPGVNSVFQNPSTTYLDCGTYTVKLVVTDATGHKDSATQTVTIRCSPTAAFNATALSGCTPFSTTFNSTSAAGSGTIGSYLWDFGDGYTGTGAQPAHTYTESGCKNITLIVTNSYNCTNSTTLTNVVCTNSAPQVNFTAGATSSCTAPFNTTYQAVVDSGLAPFAYHWVFEGGVPTTSTVAAPAVVYNSTGSFNTTLIVTDANGCTDTLTKSNFINIDTNSANFTLGSTQVCAQTAVAANGIATGTVQSWGWTSTPAGAISNPTAQSTTFTYTNAGQYNVCLNIAYAGGCTAQKCTTLVVNPAPVANFTASGLLNTCLRPNPITFTNNSTGTGLTYNWSFAGGVPAVVTNAIPPVINYNSCGTYSAALNVTDANGCTATYSAPNFLNITCPIVAITADPLTGCTPLTTNFSSTGSTGNPISWLWDFGDPASGLANTSTLANPTHTYNSPGCYRVTLTTTNAQGCVTTDTMHGYVCTGHRPHANFSANPPINCVQNPVQFTDSSTGTYDYTAYVWDFHGPPYQNESSLQNPTFIYSDTGYVSISLIVSNYGCADTITKDDLVYLIGPVSIPQFTTTCNSHGQVTLDGSASIAAQHYYWVIPGGTPATDSNIVVHVNYPSSGAYSASLLVTNDSTGCQDVLDIHYQVRNIRANFTGAPLAGCAPLISCMANTSTDAANYIWTLYDSVGHALSNLPDISACYYQLQAGNYSVRLIAGDAYNCKDTLYRPNYIHVYDAATDFVANPLSGCAPLRVDFSQTQGSPAAPTVSWQWKFGDGASGANDSSVLPQPTHIYNNTGTYTVTLTTTDSLGCVASKTRNNYIQVSQLPAGFSSNISSGCQGTLACFTRDSFGTGLTYNWDFGDGATSTVAAPCHYYTSSGTYTTTLQLSDAVGCHDSSTATNTVNVTRPHADFVADTTRSTCPPLQVRFTNLSTAVDGHSTYYWQFGDGQVSSAPNPLHIYNIAGNFDVTLIVNNANGCKDTVTFFNYIHIGGPEAHIYSPPTSGCVPHSTCMRATSATTISYTWNFGDGTVQLGADSICYTYERIGIFNPELILNDGVGCIYSVPLGEVDVNGAVAHFTTDHNFLCGNGTVQFTDSSYDAGVIQSHNWNFNDPASGNQNTSTLLNPMHYYAQAGTYNNTLTIYTSDGCTNTFMLPVTVAAPPQAAIQLSGNNFCSSNNVVFTDVTTASTPIANRIWNFGDIASGNSNASSLQNPVHSYGSAGDFIVTLLETDDNGCVDSNRTTVHVTQSPLAAFVAKDTCFNAQPVVFNNASQYGTYYAWQFGDGGTSAQVSPVHNYASPGNYTATLIVQNANCNDTVSDVVKIFPVPVADFVLSQDRFCSLPAMVLVQNNSTGAIDYLWNLGNQGMNNNFEPVVNYTAAGNYSVELTVQNMYRCYDTMIKQVVVANPPVINGITLTPAEGCAPLNMNASANAANAAAYNWNFGDASGTHQFASAQADYTYNDTGIYTVSLIVYSPEGCADSVTLPDTIKVHVTPVADFSYALNTATEPVNGTVIFTNNSQNADTYLWNFGDGTTAAEINPTHLFERSDSFLTTLYAYTNYGCMDSANTWVEVLKKSLYVPNVFAPGFTGANELVKVWKPAGTGLKTYHAQIFSTWGELLWESTKLTEEGAPAEGWDGTYQGQLSQQDVYVWKIEATFTDGTRWQGMQYTKNAPRKTVGTVTLIR